MLQSMGSQRVGHDWAMNNSNMINTPNIILSDEKLKTFPLKLGIKQRCSFCHSNSTESWKSYPQQSDKEKKRNKN